MLYLISVALLQTLTEIPKILQNEEIDLKERLSCNKDLISEMHNSAGNIFLLWIIYY